MGFGWWWSISDSLATISSKYRNQRHTRRGKPQDYFKYMNPVLPLNYFSWFSLKCSQLNVCIVCMQGAGSRNKQNLSKNLKWTELSSPIRLDLYIRVTVLIHEFWPINFCTASIILIRYFYTQIKPNTSLSLFPVGHIPVLKHVFCAFFVLKIINSR